MLFIVFLFYLTAVIGLLNVFLDIFVLQVFGLEFGFDKNWSFGKYKIVYKVFLGLIPKSLLGFQILDAGLFLSKWIFIIEAK